MLIVDEMFDAQGGLFTCSHDGTINLYKAATAAMQQPEPIHKHSIKNAPQILSMCAVEDSQRNPYIITAENSPNLRVRVLLLQCKPPCCFFFVPSSSSSPSSPSSPSVPFFASSASAPALLPFCPLVLCLCLWS